MFCWVIIWTVLKAQLLVLNSFDAKKTKVNVVSTAKFAVFTNTSLRTWNPNVINKECPIFVASNVGNQVHSLFFC